jgi:methylaspartate ammonia-lyase
VFGDLHTAVDAALACKQAQVGVLIDGGVGGTELSAQVTAHLALAVQADLVAAGPGTGVDEGIGVVHNEMMRTLVSAAQRRGAPDLNL